MRKKLTVIKLIKLSIKKFKNGLKTVIKLSQPLHCKLHILLFDITFLLILFELVLNPRNIFPVGNYLTTKHLYK